MSSNRFTIVTPTLDRSQFLDETIRSVLTQRGPFEIEYFVQDGGSGPEVLTILDHWKQDVLSGAFLPHCDSVVFDFRSERDSGMYDAINRGFAKGTGDIFAWINSDDVYFPGAFNAVREVFADNPGIDWLVGETACINAAGAITFTDMRRRAISREFVKLGYCRSDIRFFNWLPQDAIFWRRPLWEKAGPLDSSRRLTADFKLWQAFSEFADPVKVDCLVSAFRRHGDQLTADPDVYKSELDPPPRLPLGLRISCAVAWLAPNLVRSPEKVPGGRAVMKVLGLSRKIAAGRVAVWNFSELRWAIQNRAAI